MKKQFMISKVTWLLLLAFILVGCGGNSAESGKLRVVATTGQTGDAVLHIAGDLVELEVLLGAGIDPHAYVPTEGDVSRLSNADVIIYNGINLEAQMVRILEQMASRDKIVLSVGDSLPQDQLLEWGYDDTKIFDPHIWNDPMLWSQGVETMRDTLMEADPENADAFEANASAYLDSILETHDYVTNAINSIPENARVMVTAHDAFGYFSRTYGIEVLGLQGISTNSEVSTADVRAMADEITSRQIPSLFVESSVSPKTMESLIEAARAQGHEVSIGGELLSDALGEEGTDAATYTGMLRHNATTIATALGGNPGE